MLKPLLTPDHVADILHLSRRKVLELPVPKIRIGDGRGKILFKEEDVLDYLRSRTEYPEQKGANHVSGVSKKPKKMGLQVLPSQSHLEAIRVGHTRGGQERGGGGPH